MSHKKPLVEKICPNCKNVFFVRFKSHKRGVKFCGHRCAILWHKTWKSTLIPEVRAKMADTRRGSGKSDSYIKRDGRHEHRTVAEQKLGRKLIPGEVVHHKDEIKKNNDPFNLVILASQAEHARLHTLGVKRSPKMVCKRGHHLSDDNVLVTSIGRRRCRICEDAWQNSRRKNASQKGASI